MKSFLISASVLTSLLLASCSGNQGTTREETENPVIAVSFGPQAYLLDRIAGDRIEMLTLLPPGADAEHFEPSVSTMKKLSKAALWFNSATRGFESSLLERLPANFPDLEPVDLSDGIEPIAETHEGGDPHLMTSLRNLQTMAGVMTDRLVLLFPEQEEGLRENNAALQLELRQLDDSISDLFLKDSPSFIVLHPSLSYFARDYGLTQIPLEKDGKEPSPSALARALHEARERGVKVMVLDADHPAEGTKAIASSEGFRTVEVSLNDRDWLQNMRKIVAALNQ